MGCELDRVFAGQPPALPMPAPARRDDLRDLFDAVAGPLRAGRSVLVVVGDWLPPETLERLQTVHSLLDSDRVAIHITELPPLAASVLAALTAALAPFSACPGALASAVQAIGDELIVLGWAGSVAGLRHPDVLLRHHARSILPRSSFGVSLQPDRFVVPVRRSGSSACALRAPEHEVDLLIAPSERADLRWITEDVSPALGGAVVRELPPTLHGASWWGTGQLVEAVGVPTSLEWLAAAALPHHLTPCAWCREPIAIRPCPFCGDSKFATPTAPAAQADGARGVPLTTI